MPHEWDSPEYVRQVDRRWRQNRPGTDGTDYRARGFDSMQCTEKPIEVLDLGAGYGIVTREILTAYPNAQVVCLDGSGEMLKHGTSAASRMGQINSVLLYRTLILQIGLQPCLRIDSLMQWSRREPSTMLLMTVNRCYTPKSFQLLKPGGCFANHDLVRKLDDPIRDSHDPFGTVEDQVVWLKDMLGLLMWNVFGRQRAVPCLGDISQDLT